MPDLLDAIDAIVATQESIEGVKKAWPYSPPQSSLVDPVCFTNSWDLREPGNYPSANRYLAYTVDMQLYVGQATNGNDATIAARATAFWPLVMQAFQQQSAGVGGIQLHNVVSGVSTPTVTACRIRGGSPTLAILPRANVNYIGLQLFLDFELSGESFQPS